MATSLSLGQLGQFMAIVRAGSLVGATAEVGVSSPALSKALAALESQLGVLLFERVGRGLQLTENGALLAAEAEELLGHAEAVQQRFAQAVGGLRGRIRVGCGPAALQGPVGSALAGFLSTGSDVRIEIESGATAALLDRLKTFDCDLVIADSGALGSAADLARFASRALPPQRLVLAVCHDHPLMRERAPKLADLLDWPWVTPSVPVGLRDRLVARLHAESAPPAAFERVNAIPDVTIESMELCLSLAARSRAIVGSLDVGADRLAPGLALLPIDLGLQTDISIVHLRERRPSALAQRLIEAVVASASG